MAQTFQHRKQRQPRVSRSHHTPDKRSAPAGHIYDAIVIGAGDSGLMAARDMMDCGEFC